MSLWKRPNSFIIHYAVHKNLCTHLGHGLDEHDLVSCISPIQNIILCKDFCTKPGNGLDVHDLVSRTSPIHCLPPARAGCKT